MPDYFHPNLDTQQLGSLSVLGLAHMGDCVFELLVRTRLCTRGLAKSGDLHRATVAQVSAPAQAVFLDRIYPYLTPEEAAVYRRGRNVHVHGVPKKASHAQYAKATGLETLFGSLYLSGQEQRLQELFLLGLEEEDAL